MQSQEPTNPKQYCENLLKKEKQYNIEHTILPSENAIVDRLLSRDVEMQDVYVELFDKLARHPPALEVFLKLVLSTAAFWNPESVSTARKQQKDLILINKNIAEKASELAFLLKKREAHNNSSGFADDTHCSVCCVIEAAATNNYLFERYVKERLASIRGQFDLKYWPNLAAFVSEISKDAANAELFATDPITKAATTGRRPSLADFFKALLQALEGNSAQEFGQLPKEFKLTDNSIATIGNCALNLKPDHMVDGDYVKRLRQRRRQKLNENGNRKNDSAP